MKRKGLSTIITLILFFISLIFGLFLGIFKRDRPAPPAPPGYVSREEERIEAYPITPATREMVPVKRPQEKEEPPRSYRIEGVGSKEKVPVDLPDLPKPEVAEEGKKPTIKLPKELEDLGKQVKEQLDAFDEATRRSIKSMLESIDLEELEPDKATVRPKGDGLELKISVPID